MKVKDVKESDNMEKMENKVVLTITSSYQIILFFHFLIYIYIYIYTNPSARE